MRNGVWRREYSVYAVARTAKCVHVKTLEKISINIVEL